jgi:hypothetical protein
MSTQRHPTCPVLTRFPISLTGRREGHQYSVVTDRPRGPEGQRLRLDRLRLRLEKARRLKRRQPWEAVDRTSGQIGPTTPRTFPPTEDRRREGANRVNVAAEKVSTPTVRVPTSAPK